MLRAFVGGVGLAALALVAVGCEQVKQAGTQATKVEEGVKKAASEAKEAAKEAQESAKEAVEAAKTTVLKGVNDSLPKIEEKIKGLSGDAATQAKEKYEAFKKLLEEFKSAAPDKWESLKDNLLKQFAELKKLVGMDK
jgi:vacuolar-type H+-ATPase subunit E/Vma4